MPIRAFLLPSLLFNLLDLVASFCLILFYHFFTKFREKAESFKILTWGTAIYGEKDDWVQLILARSIRGEINNNGSQGPAGPPGPKVGVGDFSTCQYKVKTEAGGGDQIAFVDEPTVNQFICTVYYFFLVCQEALYMS